MRLGEGLHAAAARGKELFEGKANCLECHSGPALGANGELHEPQAVGQDPSYAERSVSGLYRATPLLALWMERPFFHDGSAENLSEVVGHYDEHFLLDHSEQESEDLVEYLKSL